MAAAPKPVGPPSGLVVTLGLAAFATAFAGRLTDPLILVLAREFGAAPDQVALLGAAYALPFALIQPVLGPVGDALGKQRVMLVALVLTTLMLTACALAPSLATLFVFRALSGAAAGGVMPLALAVMGDRVPLQDRQLAIARLLVLSISGQAAGGFVSGLLEALVGWRGVMVLCAGLAGVATAVMLAATRRGPPEPSSRFSLGLALQRYIALWRTRAAVVLYAAVFIEAVLVFGLFPYIAPLLAHQGLGGPPEAGFVVGAFGAGGLVYAVLAPRLLARLGQGRMVQAGGLVVAASFLLFALAPWLALAILAGLLLGTGFYMIHNSIQTRVTEVAPLARGSATSMHAFSFYCGQSVGVAVFGLLAAGLGLLPTLLACALGIAALGTWLGVGAGANRK
jgi:predicted MFS family arabinose efflux permease